MTLNVILFSASFKSFFLLKKFKKIQNKPHFINLSVILGNEMKVQQNLAISIIFWQLISAKILIMVTLDKAIDWTNCFVSTSCS